MAKKKTIRKKAKDKKVKVTPKNYKKLGYQYYYKDYEGKYRFTIETPDGYEIIYDEYGERIGEMS